MDKIPDYKINLDLIMEQWKKSPNIIGIITASLNRANDMEDAIFEVQELTNLDTATGINLDVLGKPWNEFRESRSDDDYRVAIKLKKLEFYSGTPEEIISILKASYNASYVTYYPEYPGKYITVSDSTITQEQQDEISMAGVTGSKGGYLIDALGNNIVFFGEFETGNILDVDGNNIIDFEGGNIQFIIDEIPGGRILHVSG